MNTHIRQATVEDASIIASLNADVHQLHAEAAPQFFKPVSAETFPAATIRDLMAKPQNRFYIANEDGIDVGYLFIELLDLLEDGMRQRRRWVYIHQIAVKPDCQAQGHGQRLVETVRELARELSIRTIALDSWSFNTKAHRFFAQQGFTPFSQRMWMEVTATPS